MLQWLLEASVELQLYLVLAEGMAPALQCMHCGLIDAASSVAAWEHCYLAAAPPTPGFFVGCSLLYNLHSHAALKLSTSSETGAQHASCLHQPEDSVVHHPNAFSKEQKVSRRA